MKTAGRIALACVAALVVVQFHSARAADWRSYKVRRTFIADQGQANPFGRSDVLAVDFLTTGFARPDGSDIVVFAGERARPVDFKLMMLGPGDRARVVVRLLEGVREYHVCYGGPAAAAGGKWEPQVGLVLETRKFNGGRIGTPHEMQALIEASGPTYGRWLVPNVFHGDNPFGPSDNYVSIYRGWLHVPADGAYRFATTSDDASYLLLDGKVVARRPRWGRGAADARFAGSEVTLKAGAHRLEYCHVEGTGTQFCVAAWQPPGEPFQLIPAAAFPGVFTAKQTGLRVAGAAVPIDLTFRLTGGVVTEHHRLYRVAFRDATPEDRSRGWAPRWTFGDGTASADRHPEHVYFLPGEYTATLTLTRGERSERIQQKIVVTADGEPLRQAPDDTAAHYFEIARTCDVDEMASDHLAAALEFFVSLEKDAEIMQAASALVERDDGVARKHLYRCAVLLGERLRDIRKQPDDALRLFAAVEQRVTDPVQKARLIRRAGDTLLYALDKPEEALAEYRKILDRHGALEDSVVRLAQIRIGDVHKVKGDYESALAAYQKAEGMPIEQRSHAVESGRRGAFAQMIEDYVARERYDEAKRLLDLWGWEHPADRVAGQWSLVAARVDLARGEREAALREALQCANTHKAGPLADKLLLLAGRILLDRKEGVRAVEIGRRIQGDYPESAEQMAAALLECKGLLAAKQNAEALKRATDVYAEYEAADALDGAEAFLMVAADAALAAQDSDRAIELLQRLLRDHRRSDLAPEARAKLKALGVRTP